MVEESQQQGPGLERPEAAQKQEQPNEPSLWTRIWLRQFLSCFWFSIPDPRVYRISEPETNTKSETNFEQDLPPAVAPLGLAMDTPTAPPTSGPWLRGKRPPPRPFHIQEAGALGICRAPSHSSSVFLVGCGWQGAIALATSSTALASTWLLHQQLLAPPVSPPPQHCPPPVFACVQQLQQL